MRRSLFLKALLTGLVIGGQAYDSALVDRSLVSDIWEDIKEAVTCAGCQVILAGLKGVSDLGTAALVDTLTGVCKLSGAADDDVCEGIISREGAVLHYVLSELSLGSEASTALCASAFGLCSYPDVRNYTLNFPSAKPDKITRPAPSGKPPIKVAHFSDTHVDLSYETGSNWNCTKPICCRSFAASDAPGNTTTPCGPYGNAKCDTPLTLEESMLNSIKNFDPAPVFSLYTGDVVAHDIWLVDKDEVLTDLNATYSLMAEVGTVYAAIGNHDTAPLNDLPTTQVPESHSANWTYQALATNFTTLTGDSSVISVAENYGSYSSVFTGSYGTDLKIISYNSIFYYVDNFYAFLDPMPYDPDGQLAWLVDELQSAETAGQRVWLIAHVPTGSSDHFHDYSHYFDQIVQRYEATIAALFFGHTHTDQFQIAYSDYANQNADTATAIGYIMPSLTPTSGPPAYRIYDIDPVTFGVLDYTVYITNVSDPDFQNGPKWDKYYSAKETYGSLLSPPVTDPSAEMTPAFWHNVTAVFESDDVAFQGYWARQTRGYDVSDCTDTSCKNQTICGLRAADAQYNCVVPSIGFNFAKRDDTDQAHVKARKEKCGDAGLVSLLGKILAQSKEASD